MVTHSRLEFDVRVEGVDPHPGIGFTRCIVNPIFGNVLHIADLWDMLSDEEQCVLLDQLNGELNEEEIG